MSKAHPPELKKLSPLSEAKECKPSTSSAPDAAAKLMSGLNLEEAVEEPSECVVCCEIRDLVQFIPCGHKIACIDCAIRMKKCLTCEEVIQHKLLKGNTSKSIQSTERKKFYELEIGKLNDEYTAKISSLTERIQQGEKLQEEKDELIKTYNEEKEKLEKTKEEERKIQEGKLEIAKCEITKLIEEKNKIEQEHLAQVEELKQMLENKEKAYEEKISELTEKLEKEKKLETAEVIILGPEAISVTPDPCHEVVVLTSDEPSSSGICTQSTQQKSKAELLEELRQEKEAREKLKKRIIECLDLELSCSICGEVFVKPVKLPCLHTFCQTCILHWERNQRDCPMCRAKYTTVGLVDTLLVCCIEKLIESTYTQDEKLKRAELVAARVEIEKQLLPSTSDSGQTRGSRGRNSGQRAVRTTRGVKRPPWRF